MVFKDRKAKSVFLTPSGLKQSTVSISNSFKATAAAAAKVVAGLSTATVSTSLTSSNDHNEAGAVQKVKPIGLSDINMGRKSRSRSDLMRRRVSSTMVFKRVKLGEFFVVLSYKGNYFFKSLFLLSLFLVGLYRGSLFNMLW